MPTLSSVCPHCLRALPLSVTTARASAPSGTGSRLLGWLRPALLALVALAGGAYLLRGYRVTHAPEPVPEPVAAEVTTTIAPPLDVPIADTASVTIPPGGHVAFAFSGGGRSGCRVHGAVQAISGGNRLIVVSVVDRDGLAELESGRTPRTYYDSGAQGDVALDLNVDGRTEYALVITNPAGERRGKSVRIRKVSASCSD